MLQVSSLAKQIVSLWKDKVSSTSASQLASKAGSSLLPRKPKAAAAVAGRSAAAAAAAAERIRGNAKQLLLKALQQHCDAVEKVSEGEHCSAECSAGAEGVCGALMLCSTQQCVFVCTEGVLLQRIATMLCWLLLRPDHMQQPVLAQLRTLFYTSQPTCFSITWPGVATSRSFEWRLQLMTPSGWWCALTG
jgi:hypothetical protein